MGAFGVIYHQRREVGVSPSQRASQGSNDFFSSYVVPDAPDESGGGTLHLSFGRCRVIQ